MPIILTDANIEGHVAYLEKLIRRDEAWNFYAEASQLEFKTFTELGLSHDASDREVWNVVQKHAAIMLTDNRNHDDADSLQAVLEDSNTLKSVPILTIGDVDRVLADRAYADHVVEALLERVMALENLLGTGRLYIP